MVVKNIVNQSPSSSVLSKVVFFVSFFIFTPSLAYLYYTDYNIVKNINELEKQYKGYYEALQNVIVAVNSDNNEIKGIGNTVSKHSNYIDNIDRQLTGTTILMSKQDAELKTQSNELKSLNNELSSLKGQMGSLVSIGQYNSSNIAILSDRMSKLDFEIKNINDKINGLSQFSSISGNKNAIGDGVFISDKSTQLQDVKENENTYLKDDFKVNSTSSKNTEQMNTAYSSAISADPNYSSNSAMNTTLSSVGNKEVESQSNTETLPTIQELNDKGDVLSKDVPNIKEKVKTYGENDVKFKEDLNVGIDNMQENISESAMSTSSRNYSWSFGSSNCYSLQLRRSVPNKSDWFYFPFFKEPIFMFRKYYTNDSVKSLQNLNQPPSADNAIYALSWYFKLIELNVMNNSLLGIQVSLLCPILPLVFIGFEDYFMFNTDLLVVHVNFNLLSYIVFDFYFKIDALFKKIEILKIAEEYYSKFRKGVIDKLETFGKRKHSSIFSGTGATESTFYVSICLV